MANADRFFKSAGVYYFFTANQIKQILRDFSAKDITH